MERNPKEVTIKDIFDAVGEEISLTPCTSDTDPRSPCSREEKCITHSLWVQTSNRFEKYFQGITLQNIIDDKI